MAITQTFGGGVHPLEVGNGKKTTCSLPIVNAAAPAKVTIAMVQHGGAPAVCCVKVGQTVNLGQVIGTAQGVFSAPVHASVSGKVISVGSCTIAGGRSVPAVVIENDREDRWDDTCVPCEQIDQIGPEQIAAIAAEKGVVGLGGAGFPTSIKLGASQNEQKIDTLIINGSECEPYLTCDHRMMVEEPKRIMDGIVLAMKALGVTSAKIGIENNKPDAIDALKTVAAQGVEVISLPAKYPQGFEKMLIYALTGRKVLNGKLPSSVGCAVLNVSTCAALSDAVLLGRPIIDRVVTVAGRVAEPKNLRVRIGTNLMDVIDQVGGLTDGIRKIIAGGPMMGNALSTLNVPITKGFSGCIALGDESISAEESACIRCGRCMRACPMGLAPAKIDALVRKANYEGAAAIGAVNCMECGSCTYVCPAKRELTQSCRVAKMIAKSKKV